MSTKQNLNVHLGELNDNTCTRLVIAYKQIPDNIYNCLAIKVDSMIRDIDKDELMNMVRSDLAQQERDFITVLHKHNLLKFYHDNHYFTVYPIDDVVMTPGNGQKIPLRDVINSLNARNGNRPLPTKEELKSLSSANPHASQKKRELEQTDSNAAIAKNILFEAKLLQVEANRKIQEAYKLDPTLGDADKVKETLEKEMNNVESLLKVKKPTDKTVTTKKKPGPKKKTA